ncbi:gfo/Idh/MocA family oxidoreductase, partial [Rathayibacter caricis]|uniref:Gfo/Idh/MocA family protein n=1 Tax=Rathayibacter caricis TaxID=110936 RepID=UPI003FD70941|nr:gfo/Idh/MocA family oxidoreductase [Rathayibacter caricis]
SAPDTVLGPGFQTAKRAIAEGVIGEPMFASTTFQTVGPDLWHPSPAFLFAQGAGPLLDMGPYYFTGLVSLFGPVERVAALGRKKLEERVIRSGPDAGTMFPVEVPTSLQVLTSFAAGQQAASLLSFDSALERHGVFEIHGTEGSLVIPDPNQFEGRTAFVKAPTSIADGA